jgi:hypothetical protein
MGNTSVGPNLVSTTTSMWWARKVGRWEQMLIPPKTCWREVDAGIVDNVDVPTPGALQQLLNHKGEEVPFGVDADTPTKSLAG